MNTNDDRYITVQESLSDACREMMDIRNGKKQGRSWQEILDELKKL